MKKYFFVIGIVGFLLACANNNSETNHYKQGNLEFFETYEFSEIQHEWNEAVLISQTTVFTEKDSATMAKEATIPLDKISEGKNLGNLVGLTGSYEIGYVDEKDLAIVDSILQIESIASLFPPDMVFMWSHKPTNNVSNKKMYVLYAVKIPDGGKARVDGKDIARANVVNDEQSGNLMIEISMSEKGADKWEKMTSDNVNRVLVMTMDRKVLSAPRVMSAISGGTTQISGAFDRKEADELAGRINARVK